MLSAAKSLKLYAIHAEAKCINKKPTNNMILQLSICKIGCIHLDYITHI